MALRLRAWLIQLAQVTMTQATNSEMMLSPSQSVKNEKKSLTITLDQATTLLRKLKIQQKHKLQVLYLVKVSHLVEWEALQYKQLLT